MHDFSDHLERRIIGEAEPQHHGLKRTERAVMTKVSAWHIESDLMVFRLSGIANPCIRIDPSPNEPDTGQPINMWPRARYPRAIEKGGRCEGWQRRGRFVRGEGQF